MGTLNTCVQDARTPDRTVWQMSGSLPESHGSIGAQLSAEFHPDTTAGSGRFKSEWHLVQDAIAGDVDALENLFTRDRASLYRISLGELRNREDAADALQESLCKAYANLQSFQGRSSFSTWMTRIVVNTALMAKRKKTRRSEASLDEMVDEKAATLPRGVVDSRPDPEKLCAQGEVAKLIEDQLQLLSPRLQAAYRLYSAEDLSFPRLSEVLGIPSSTFKSRVSRARRTLARAVHDSIDKTAGAWSKRVTRTPTHAD